MHDNAKTHEPKPSDTGNGGRDRHRSVRRSNSMPMDLMRSGPARRRKRYARRGSDPPSRWSAMPPPTCHAKAPKKPVMANSNASHPLSSSSSSPSSPSSPSPSTSSSPSPRNNKADKPPTCVVRNVFQPVRQESLEDLRAKASDCDKSGRLHSLMPTMPVRQQSLRDMVGGGGSGVGGGGGGSSSQSRRHNTSPSPQGNKKNKIKKTNQTDATVTLITQALKQLDSLSEMDEDHDDNATLNSSFF